MTLALRYAVRSDVGLLREGNEDSAYAGPHLLAVADGMGGYEAGEVASASVIASIAPLDSHPVPESELVEALSKALVTAKETLRGIVGTDPAVGSMGTTLTALLWSNGVAALCHIGDSRAYLLRDGEFFQVTRDHTFVQALVDQGRIRPEEAATHPQRSLLLRALDGKSDADPDLSVLDVKAGDRFLLCSDGLPVAASDEAILQALSETPEPADSVLRLIELAIAGGGPDNITCIVADVVDTKHSRFRPTSTPVFAGAAATENVHDTRPLGKAVSEADAGLTSLRTILTDGTAGSVASAGGSVPVADIGPGGGQAPPARRREAAADARRRRRLPVMSLVLVLFVVLIGVGLLIGYQVTQSQYYVGISQGQVAIYRGLNQSLFGISLSHVYQRTPVQISLVPPTDMQAINRVSAGSLAQARHFVANIRMDSCAAAYARLRQWELGKPKPIRVKRRVRGRTVVRVIIPPYHKPKPVIPSFCAASPAA
jgi:serine/threonine protein phosphatase PrpC